MKKINSKPSPLKQQGPQGGGGAGQEIQKKQKLMVESGMDILGNGQKNKNWEELQLDIKMIEPQTMMVRKLKDQALRNEQRKIFDAGSPIALPGTYMKIIYKIVKRYKDELYQSLLDDDKAEMGKIKQQTAILGQVVDVIKESTADFFDDMFNPESLISKGNSQQQISFATQMYCNNPELRVVQAAKEDVIAGRDDYYGEIVHENHLYALIYDFYNNVVMIPVTSGTKDLFIVDNLKATEYLGFLNEINEKATQANTDKAAVKIDLGGINYKIDSIFGYNDGTATKKQDELVLSFAWDDSLLQDGSTFRRHLYEHPNIQNLNYGGFDFAAMQMNLPLGPGDKNFWYDKIDDVDKLRLVDAIVNQDSPFFDMNLLRTLVKEYYTRRIEDAWWKGMGFEEGRLDVMRLKQMEILKQRFKMEKAKASQDGRKDFTFDGEVFSTGLTDADIKKQKKEEDKILKEMREKTKA